MATNFFSNIQGRVNDFRNNDFSGFTIDLHDERDFASLIRKGQISNISLFNAPENTINNLPEFDDWITGKEVGVYAKGNKLFETQVSSADLRFGGSSETLNFDIPNKLRGSEELADVFPQMASKLPDEVHNVNDLAQAFNIEKLRFKPVKNVKDKAKETVDKTVKNNDMSKNSKLGIGLLAVPVVVYTVYKVIQ